MSFSFDILLSVIISYIIIKIFNRHPPNKLESSDDYFEYYIVNNVKDIIKTALIVPILFLLFRFLLFRFFNKNNSNYNTSIITNIINELYRSFVIIAKNST